MEALCLSDPYGELTGVQGVTVPQTLQEIYNRQYSGDADEDPIGGRKRRSCSGCNDT